RSVLDYRISHVMLCDVRQGARREDDSDGVAFREVGEQECAWVAELDPEHELVWFQRRILRAEGIVTSISAVEYDNVASARLHLRMGARRAGSVTTVLALGLRLHLDRVQRRWRLRVGRSPFPLESLAGRESPMEATQLAVGRTGL